MAKRVLSDTMNHDKIWKGAGGFIWRDIPTRNYYKMCQLRHSRILEPSSWHASNRSRPRFQDGAGGHWQTLRPYTFLKSQTWRKNSPLQFWYKPRVRPKRRCFPLRHGATFQRNIFVASPTARISGGADVVLRSWKEHDFLSKNLWFHAHILCFLNKHATIITVHLTYHPKEELFNKAFTTPKRKAAILHTFTLTLPETWRSPGWKTIQLPCMRSPNFSGACC